MPSAPSALPWLTILLPSESHAFPTSSSPVPKYLLFPNSLHWVMHSTGPNTPQKLRWGFIDNILFIWFDMYMSTHSFSHTIAQHVTHARTQTHPCTHKLACIRHMQASCIHTCLHACTYGIQISLRDYSAGTGIFAPWNKWDLRSRWFCPITNTGKTWPLIQDGPQCLIQAVPWESFSPGPGAAHGKGRMGPPGAEAPARVQTREGQTGKGESGEVRGEDAWDGKSQLSFKSNFQTL